MRFVTSLIALCVGWSPAHGQEVADTIFLNGKIFTADANGTVRQAMAVKGDRFVAVGDNGSVSAHRGPATRIVDLHGRFVAPGFGDDHFHNEGGGSGVDLSNVRSVDELLAAVAARVAKTPRGEVVTSNPDWHEAQLKEQRLPTVAELDRVSPHHPLVLLRGGHEYILNSAALRKWGITRDTPSPAGGVVSKDAKGELTGELFDNAMNLVELPPSPPLSTSDILLTQKVANSYGLTSVRIPGAYKGKLLDAYHLMQRSRDAGQLSLRYTIYLPGFDLSSAEQVRGLLSEWDVKQDEGDDWVRIGGVKLMIDGGFEGGHMSEPYEEPWGKGGTYAGVTKVPPGPYNEVVKELNRLGWRPTTHAVGDAGIDQVLAAYEAADAEQPIAGKRWAIEHAFTVRPEQIARLKALDIALSVQDHLYVVAPVLKKYWGAERASQVTPVKTYLDAGLLVAGGTDSYVIPLNPMWELYHFHTRDTISAGRYGENQAVPSREELLKLITINYARLVGTDRDLGSIEPGKLADFVILSGDFLTVPSEQMRDLKPLATYVGGNEAYRDPAWK